MSLPSISSPVLDRSQTLRTEPDHEEHQPEPGQIAKPVVEVSSKPASSNPQPLQTADNYGRPQTHEGQPAFDEKLQEAQAEHLPTKALSEEASASTAGTGSNPKPAATAEPASKPEPMLPESVPGKTPSVLQYKALSLKAAIYMYIYLCVCMLPCIFRVQHRLLP